LPINFIKRPSSKTLKKQFRSTSTAPSVISNIICGFKDIVKPSQRHSFISGNKYYPNEYSDSNISSPPKEQQKPSSKRPLTPDLVDKSNRNERMNNGIKLPSSISSPNLAKQDSNASTLSANRTGELINFSEDYSKIVEEREKKMEEQRRSSQSRSSLSNGSSGGERTPKARKKTVLLPGAPNREIKPAVILSLADRDLVVIDKHDIKEAVNNESQVIIVDPPTITSTQQDEHTDLVDILGSNWPQDAGHAGALLNNEKKSSSTSSTSSSLTNNGWRTVERNKSANFASHLSNSKPRYESTTNGYENNKTLPKKSKFPLIYILFLTCSHTVQTRKIIFSN
jgi:hypothetical protein